MGISGMSAFQILPLHPAYVRGYRRQRVSSASGSGEHININVGRFTGL